MITLSPKNPMRAVLLTVLFFEVIVFGLAVPVMILVSSVPAEAAAAFAGGSAALALLAAGLLRSPIGYVLAWLTQLAGVALGLLTPVMFAIGGMFAGLWLLTFVLGKRLDAAGAPGPAS